MSDMPMMAAAKRYISDDLREAADALRVLRTNERVGYLMATAADELDSLKLVWRSHRQLVDAASAVVAQWDTPNWRLEQSTAALVNDLRAAIRKASGEA